MAVLSNDCSANNRADVSFAVVARFRPPNKAELANGGDQIVDFETEDTCSINVRKASMLHPQSHSSCLERGKERRIPRLILSPVQ